MARIRTIKPEFWADEGVGELTIPARLLYIATWNLADDEGLLRWTPDFLKSEAFRYDPRVGVITVAKLMAELVDGDFVFPYTGGRAHQALAFVVRFRDHQRINRPGEGRLPPPSLANHEVRVMYARRDRWICHLCRGLLASNPQNPEFNNEKKALTIDHLVPRSKGGSDFPSNLKIAHSACNSGRRDRPVEEFSVPYSLRDSVNHSVSPPVSNSLSEQGTGNREGEQGAGMRMEPRALPSDERIFAALEEHFGPPEPADRAALYASVTLELLAMNATLEQIDERSSECQRRYPLATPKALANHWHELGATQAPGWMTGIHQAVTDVEAS